MNQSNMSQEAASSDEQMTITHLLVANIFSDSDFNCRQDPIAPIDVIDLANDIAKNGLQVPIVVRPCFPSDPDKYEWRIISGHRRYKAYQLNDVETIPCIIRQGLDLFKCKTLNAIENLKRKDLNMFEEALTVEHYKNAGWSRGDVALELGMSNGWVQIRFMILNLPDELKSEVAAGIFNQNQIRDLNTLKGQPEKQIEAALIIKKAVQKGETKGLQILPKKPQAMSRRRRSTSECYELMEIIMDTMGDFNFGTRCLAWAAGTITNYDIHVNLKELAEENGREYSIPDFS